MSKRAKSTKYVFTLKGVNISHINSTYGISSNTENLSEQNVANTTKLIDLDNGKITPEIISFLDESRRLHTCNVSMIDFTSKMDVALLKYHCFWDRHPFNTQPIGCPIRYVSNQVEKKYHSHISRDTYTIKENITHKCSDKITNTEPSNLTLISGDYYETDGIFCSFNCCKSWINDNRHNRMYDLSEFLLIKMYNDMMGTKFTNISPAPCWRLLENYGGHLNIIKFRDSFNKVEYKCYGNIKSIPNFLPIKTIYEENIKF